MYACGWANTGTRASAEIVRVDFIIVILVANYVYTFKDNLRNISSVKMWIFDQMSPLVSWKKDKK